MKHEMDLVRQLNSVFGVPIREHYDPKAPQSEFDFRLRLVNEETTELSKALMARDLVLIADGIADTQVVCAGTNVQLGLDPTSEYFADAARELIEDARAVFRQGIVAKQPGDILGGTVMLEIIVRGIAACLNIPYVEVFNEVHANNMSKVGADGKPIFDKGGKYLKPEGWKPPRIREILESAGLITKQEPANGQEG